MEESSLSTWTSASLSSNPCFGLALRIEEPAGVGTRKGTAREEGRHMAITRRKKQPKERTQGKEVQSYGAHRVERKGIWREAYLSLSVGSSEAKGETMTKDGVK